MGALDEYELQYEDTRKSILDARRLFISRNRHIRSANSLLRRIRKILCYKQGHYFIPHDEIGLKNCARCATTKGE